MSFGDGNLKERVALLEKEKRDLEADWIAARTESAVLRNRVDLLERENATVRRRFDAAVRDAAKLKVLIQRMFVVWRRFNSFHGHEAPEREFVESFEKEMAELGIEVSDAR